jgi:aspartyl-tRNA(Asn)/glutamyl-tRNA(Gln) amidotransferase subunit C
MELDLVLCYDRLGEYMKFTKNDVSKLADLSRLDLKEDEKEKFSNQIGDILNYAEKLSELDLKNVDITSQVNGLENIFREDEIKIFENQDLIIDSFPEKDKKSIKVSSVFNK